MKKNNNSHGPEFKRGLTEEEINSPEFNPDDFAPAPDKKKTESNNERLENKRNALVFALVIGLFALIIGLIGWAASAGVNAYFDSLDAKNVLSLYKNCDRVEEYDAGTDEYDVYAVFFKNRMAGYCVIGEAKGFGGRIELLCAFNSDNKISDVKIVEHSESRGLGSLITTEDFLGQFNGLLVGNTTASFDLISGATTSSTAVGEAIKAILGLGLSTDSIAKELGYDTITEEEIEEEVQKEEENKPTSETEKADTTDASPDVGDFQGGANVNNGDGDLGHTGEDMTTLYDTETNPPEEDDETTKADTTEPVEESSKDEESTASPETSAPTEESTDASTDTTVPTDDTTTADTTVADTTAPEAPETTLPPTEETTGPAAAQENE